jgi:histone H4
VKSWFLVRGLPPPPPLHRGRESGTSPRLSLLCTMDEGRRLSVAPNGSSRLSDAANDAETRQVGPRHRPVGHVPVRTWRRLRDSSQGITKQAIRRLARRGGVKRMGSDQSGDIYTEARGALKVFLSRVLDKAIIYTGHARRKTVTTMDIVMGLKANGVTLYGHGGGFPIAGRPTPKAVDTQQHQSATKQPPTGATPPPPPPPPPPQACNNGEAGGSSGEAGGSRGGSGAGPETRAALQACFGPHSESCR